MKMKKHKIQNEKKKFIQHKNDFLILKMCLQQKKRGQDEGGF